MVAELLRSRGNSLNLRAVFIVALDLLATLACSGTFGEHLITTTLVFDEHGTGPRPVALTLGTDGKQCTKQKTRIRLQHPRDLRQSANRELALIQLRSPRCFLRTSLSIFQFFELLFLSRQSRFQCGNFSLTLFF